MLIDKGAQVICSEQEETGFRPTFSAGAAGFA
jgi:hypothetical protein